MIFFPVFQLVQWALFASAAGSSMAYLPVLITIWKYFPEKRGIPTSLCLSGLGLNRLVFKYGSLHIINPEEIGLTENKDRYPEAINENFIFYMKLLLCFYCIMGLLAMFCIFPYDDGEVFDLEANERAAKKKSKSILDPSTYFIANDQYTINSSYIEYPNSVSYNGLLSQSINESQIAQTKETEESLCSLFTSVPFIQLTCMFFCSRSTPYLFNANLIAFSTIELSSMKKFGIMNGHSESFVNFNSWVWKLANFSCFQFWGILIDKNGFKKVYMSIILLQIAISSSIYFIAENKYTFFLCHLLTAGANSGNITLAPVSYMFIFGIDNGSLLFSLSSMITNTFYICRPLFRSYVNEKIDFLIFYLIISLFSMFGLIILCFFDEKRRTKESKALERTTTSISTTT